MGATGSGKSTFINTVANEELKVGHGLASETNDVVPVEFELMDRRVILIDTPGFEDAECGDYDILIKITAFLEELYGIIRYPARNLL